MKRFIAIMNDGSFINIPATSMKIEDNAIIVSNGNDVVAYVDLSFALCAHISDRKDDGNG
jgi:hypothetical protein